MVLFGEYYFAVLDSDGRLVTAEIFSSLHRRDWAFKRISERFPYPAYSLRAGKLGISVKTFHGLNDDALKALADNSIIFEEVLRRAAEDERRRITSTSEMFLFLLAKYEMVIAASIAFAMAYLFILASEHYEIYLYIRNNLKRLLSIHISKFLFTKYTTILAAFFFTLTIFFIRIYVGDWFSAFIISWIFYIIPMFFLHGAAVFFLSHILGFF